MLHFWAAAVLVAMSSPVESQPVNFGNNSSEWAKDGECDDRRFTGDNMAHDLDYADTARDARDCKAALKAGKIKVWVEADAKAATQCNQIKFGNNSSEWARDDECDDYRFEGRGMSTVVSKDDILKDAADCKALCNTGLISLRNY